MTKIFSKALVKLIATTALVALSCQDMNASDINVDMQTQSKSTSSWGSWFGYGQQQPTATQESSLVPVPIKKPEFKLVLWLDAWDGDHMFEGKGTNSVSLSDPVMAKKTALNFLNSGKFETTLSIEDDRGEIKNTAEWVSFLQGITQLDHLEVSPGFKKSESYQVIVDALSQITTLKSLEWRVSQVQDDATKPFQLICMQNAANLESINLMYDFVSSTDFSYFAKLSMPPEFPNLKIVDYSNGNCNEKMYLDFIEFLSQAPNLEYLHLPQGYKYPTDKVFESLEEILKTKTNLKGIFFANYNGGISHVVNILNSHVLQTVKFDRNFVQVENWQGLVNALKGAAQIKDLEFKDGSFSSDQSKDMKLESLAEMSSLESLSFGSEIGKSANQVNGLVQALLKRPTPLGFLQISVSEETLPLFTDLMEKGTQIKFIY